MKKILSIAICLLSLIMGSSVTLAGPFTVIQVTVDTNGTLLGPTNFYNGSIKPLTNALAKAGINEDVIVTQIGNSHTVYHLSAADIIDLRDAGVSDKVITYMINTASMAAAAPAPVVVQQAPPPPPVETVVVSPGPDYVWVGGEWVWQGGGWVWVGGHWIYPPRPHAVWVVGYSWHDRYGWHHDHGHWR